MITSDLLNPLNENIFKSKSVNKLLESMTKTGLVSTGAKPRSSHLSQEEWEMVRWADNFGLDIPTESQEVMIASRVINTHS